jgi:hypothetical protein
MCKQPAQLRTDRQADDGQAYLPLDTPGIAVQPPAHY